MVTTENKAPDINEFKAILRKYSLKATPQRLAVHDAMLRLGHASADMVSDEINKAGVTKVTVASVYNILTHMALLGVYQHRLSSNNKMYFDVNNFAHVHLYDVVNNTYKDVIDNDLQQMLQSRFAGRRFKGYRIEGVDVQILCRPTK